MIEQEDYDQKIGWFIGLFVGNGLIYMTRHGQDSRGWTRFKMHARVDLHITRYEVLHDIVELLNVGTVLRKKGRFAPRIIWETTNMDELEIVLEILEQAVTPLPKILHKQIGLAREFLETRMSPGRKDEDMLEQVQWTRGRIYDALKNMKHWRKGETEEFLDKWMIDKGWVNYGDKPEGAY